MGPEQERQLIAAATSGDRQAFAALAALHECPLYAFALRLSGDPEFAVDAVQETLLRALSSLPRFDPGKDFRSWLLGIAAHLCTDWLRCRNRRRQAETDDSLPQDSAGIPDMNPDSDPHEATQRQELREMVAAAVRRLPPSHRTVLLLRFEHGMKVKEIAETMKLKPKAVEIRIRRAKAMLRPFLEPLYPELASRESTQTIDQAAGGQSL